MQDSTLATQPTTEQLLTPEDAAIASTLQAAINADPGHGRHWSPTQAVAVVQRLRDGRSLRGACHDAGLDPTQLYRIVERHPSVGQAVSTAYARDGADAWEDRLWAVANGDGDPRAVPAIGMALKLRGKLQNQPPTGQGSAPSIVLQFVVVQPPARESKLEL